MDIRSDAFETSRNYSQTCRYTEPSHVMSGDEIVVEMSFVCDMATGQREDYTGVYYAGEAINGDGTQGSNEFSFSMDNVNKTVVSGQSRITKTIRKSTDWLRGKEGGVLGVFTMKTGLLKSVSGPVAGIRYFIEDNKRFDGTRDNPFIPGLLSVWYFTVYHGALMNDEHQAYIYCRAFGHDVPDVDVYKVGDIGNDVSLTYPKFALRTKYSINMYYIINYPTAADASNYSCRARLGNKERTLRFPGLYEPENPPVYDRSRSKTVYKYYEVYILHNS